MLSCEFCEISKNTFSTEHLQRTASGGILGILGKIDNDVIYFEKFSEKEKNFLVQLFHENGTVKSGAYSITTLTFFMHF